jgi:hypothetical protein
MVEEATPAPIIVTALFGNADHALLNGLRRQHFPPERNQLAAHLTMFHHLPPSVAPELSTRLVQLTRRAPPEARLSSVMNLGRGVALRVQSPALEEMRAELAHALAGMLTPQDAGGWRPHVTIQNKASPAAAKALMEEMTRNFSPRPLQIAALGAFYYRGGPWELIRRFAFRGSA